MELAKDQAGPAGQPMPQEIQKQTARQANMEQQFQARVQEVQTANEPAFLPATSLGTLPAKFELPKVGSTFRFRRLVVLPGAASMLSLTHAPKWLGTGAWWLMFLCAGVLFWFLGRYAWAAVRGGQRFWRPAWVFALVGGFTGVSIVCLAMFLPDTPMFYGLLAALIVWSFRQVFLRGWPVKPFLAWRRAKKGMVA
jgi:hypothetical protein